jgi:hypothetical protein
MLNANARNIIAGCLSTGTAKIKYVNGLGDGNLNGTSSTTGVYALFGGIYNIPSKSYATSISSKSTGVYFGKTAHTPTINDFEFADTNDLISLSGSGTAPITEIFDDYIDITTSLSVTNGANESVTVSELYYLKFYNNSAAYLLDHTVLDTPVVFGPGDSKVITYTIRINF